MRQLWTIIFVILCAIAWGVAAWHDREDKAKGSSLKRKGAKE